MGDIQRAFLKFHLGHGADQLLIFIENAETIGDGIGFSGSLGFAGNIGLHINTFSIIAPLAAVHNVIHRSGGNDLFNRLSKNIFLFSSEKIAVFIINIRDNTFRIDDDETIFGFIHKFFKD